MLLTQRQIQTIDKLKKNDKGGMVLELSVKQLEQNMQKEGGFLLMLAGLRALSMLAKSVLPALGVDTLSCLSSAAMSKAFRSSFYLKRGSNVCCVKARGEGLYLTSGQAPSTYGNCLYLKHDKQFYDGQGLILGPNIPFKKSPLLGMLL